MNTKRKNRTTIPAGGRLPVVIMMGGDLNEKAWHSLRSLSGFFVCLRSLASQDLHKQKTLPLSR